MIGAHAPDERLVLSGLPVLADDFGYVDWFARIWRKTLRYSALRLKNYIDSNVRCRKIDVTGLRREQIMKGMNCLIVGFSFWVLTLPCGSWAGTILTESEGAQDCVSEEVGLPRQPIKLNALEQLDQGNWGEGNRKRQNDLWISAEEAKKLLTGSDSVGVDVRHSEDSGNLHSPNILNIPPKQLASKSFLKNKKLILMDSGFAVSELETLTKQLNDAGFEDVHILEGGSVAWLQTFIPSNAVQRIILIGPQQFYLERDYQDVEVIEIESTLLMEREPLEKFLQRKLVNVDSANKVRRTVLVTGDGQGTDAIALVFSAIESPPVFFLTGGKQGYRNFLRRQQAIWNRPKEKQGDISTCGRRRG